MLAEARLKALQAQIEPHFLYNTLANVVSLIGPHPAQAQHMLERFIDYLRASLAASRSEQATLGSEAKLIAAYLDVLAVRMGERLRYRIEVPDALGQFAIAPMLLQPVVENAISHGLEPKVEGGEIVVSARIEGAHVCVQISDTGAGLNEAAPAKPGGGVGLGNLRERLRTLYGGEARVELLENQPCGMTVRLMLPLNASPTSIPSAP
jgi:sensor histidine kinase YesM